MVSANHKGPLFLHKGDSSLLMPLPGNTVNGGRDRPMGCLSPPLDSFIFYLFPLPLFFFFFFFLFFFFFFVLFGFFVGFGGPIVPPLQLAFRCWPDRGASPARRHGDRLAFKS